MGTTLPIGPLPLRRWDSKHPASGAQCHKGTGGPVAVAPGQRWSVAVRIVLAGLLRNSIVEAPCAGPRLWSPGGRRVQQACLQQGRARSSRSGPIFSSWDPEAALCRKHLSGVQASSSPCTPSRKWLSAYTRRAEATQQAGSNTKQGTTAQIQALLGAALERDAEATNDCCRCS